MEHNDDYDDDDDDAEDEGSKTTPIKLDYNLTPRPPEEDIPVTTMNKTRGQILVKHLSLKVILLIGGSSLQIRRRETPLQEFILR